MQSLFTNDDDSSAIFVTRLRYWAGSACRQDGYEWRQSGADASTLTGLQSVSD